MEEWRDIEGYEGLYQVSNFGNVRSLNYHREGKSKILKTSLNNKGYQLVSLYKNNKRKTFQVHRLVAQAFIPNPNNYPIINHKDEKPLNNCVENLEWCTYSYNNNYGTKIERQRQKMCGENCYLYRKFGKLHHKSKTINQYTKDGEFIKKWDSTADVERELGFNTGHISSCALGKRKSANGFIWKYKYV